jgi:hypothetical protein
MRPISVTVGPLATANAAIIAASQQPLAAGNLTLVGGGTVTLDTPRRVLITDVGTDTSVIFTVYGTDARGRPISESLAGATAGNSVYTVLDYLTVTRIAVSAATASTITVGTNGIASSRWVMLDHYSFPQVALQCVPTGTANFTVQQSLDDPAKVGFANVTWVNHSDSNLVGATATVQGNYAYLPRVARILLNSGTGSVKLTVLQAGTPNTR